MVGVLYVKNASDSGNRLRISQRQAVSFGWDGMMMLEFVVAWLDVSFRLE